MLGMTGLTWRNVHDRFAENGRLPVTGVLWLLKALGATEPVKEQAGTWTTIGGEPIRVRKMAATAGPQASSAGAAPPHGGHAGGGRAVGISHVVPGKRPGAIAETTSISRTAAMPEKPEMGLVSCVRPRKRKAPGDDLGLDDTEENSYLDCPSSVSCRNCASHSGYSGARLRRI